MKKINNIYIALMLLVFGACDDFDSDLDVQNLEEPSSTQIGIESTADNLFKNWYQTVNSYYGPGLALATMSDSASLWAQRNPGRRIAPIPATVASPALWIPLFTSV